MNTNKGPNTGLTTIKSCANCPARHVKVYLLGSRIAENLTAASSQCPSLIFRQNTVAQTEINCTTYKAKIARVTVKNTDQSLFIMWFFFKDAFQVLFRLPISCQAFVSNGSSQHSCAQYQANISLKKRTLNIH